MNSRKKRFWKLWDARNKELAETNPQEAKRIREQKFLNQVLKG